VFAKGEFSFNLNGASTMIFNTDVDSAAISANFLGGSAQGIGGKTIWNFYGADTLDIGAQFGGSILALGATLTNTQNIEGGVFVNKLVQNGEIHLAPFDGVLPVPEPETYGMLLAGLALVGMAARRRQAAR
jgi:choice-of-anchor A domain-containing protein